MYSNNAVFLLSLKPQYHPECCVQHVVHVQEGLLNTKEAHEFKDMALEMYEVVV